jgi:hypothetical protein
MHYEDRHYVIFNTSELSLIDFNEVMETSAETVRLSIDGLKTFVKYEGEMPPSVQSLTTKTSPYTHDEMLEILSTSEWNAPINQE